jgi:Methyltransferase domain
MSAVEVAAPYAAPRHVADPRDCAFYHSMDLPGHGSVEGLFDLRGAVDEYLGGVDLGGKRVLEIGTADGFLCFEMERRGAEVVAYDLSEAQRWDFVPAAGGDAAALMAEYQRNVRRLNDAFWLAHRLHGSHARVVYGSVYDVPASIGPVDVATFGCVLLHVRDPFLALARGAALARERVVVTEVLGGVPRLLARLFAPVPVRRLAPWWRVVPALAARLSPASPVFVPDARRPTPTPTWWSLGPRCMGRYLALLGFEEERVTYHFQRAGAGVVPMYTVVAKRRGRPEMRPGP